ncbi:beta-galactosidase small subunit-related protein [Halocatena pleomorpha]|uniref:beta-galactosidase n=1 Tax=Halocatena pleomorpha TaxID=1785090 RepID=A0A3P3R9L8_9EURY|nr:glycoside hydrolase family 2 TIM barrel-domain containing protein [Halocatena pleomorpha]RRJ30146.1 DUF4981 domain-containing protein [Halocatena pleomorpha]
MSENETSTPETDYTTTRRRFLQMTGGTALVSTAWATETVAGADSPLAPSTETGGPGRITNLAAYIETPSVFEQHREPTHATATIPYDSVETARRSDERFTSLADRFTESEYCTLLNGEWRFSFYERPDQRPATHTDTDWETTTVPRPWQIDGYDQQIYANWRETWTRYEPQLEGDLVPSDGSVDIPDVNPTGTYQREFRVPADWDNRRVFVHFAGVKQAYFVWIDDQYVGFQQGSMTPGEFDITEHITPGSEHEITVQVYRFSDGEALEAIDMFRYAGIYRDVYLFSTPSVHVRDFAVESGLDDEYRDGHLRIDAEVANYADAVGDTYSIRASLHEPDGDGTKAELVGQTTIDSDGGVVSMERTISRPEQWSAEQPTLYTLVLELISERGQTIEVLLDKVGFRTYEASRGGPGGQVLVNGEPVNLRGTNRHETDPETGRTMPLETMRADIELMKRFNVNAVRTSHYPNDPTFLRLADEYGIYVMDEACCETHWWEGILAETDAYHEQAVSRFRRMVLRDRNHASVFSWSTGNEAGTAAEHINMAALAIGADDPTIPDSTADATRLAPEPVESFDGTVEAPELAPNRLLYHQPNSGGWDIEFADMLGPRYIELDTLLGLAEGADVSDSPRFGDRSSGDGSPGNGNRPVVMGEYNHAMGSSLGLVHRMWANHIQPTVRRARDGSGTGHDGVLVGSPTVDTGRTDGSITVRGDDHVDVEDTDALSFTSPGFSIAVSFAEIHPKTSIDLVSNDGQYALSLKPGRRPAFSVGDRSAVGSPLTAASEEGWHTLVGVCQEDRLQLYFNGELITETDRSPEQIDNGGAVRIGTADHEGRSEPSVTIDSVRVFDRALSVDEVQTADPDAAILDYSFGTLLRDKSLHGGFIWDWVNQDLTRTTTDDGEQVRYQFYDEDPFCLNGMVWSDREPQPELWQLKHSHQPVKAEPQDLSTGKLYVTNHHQFTNVNELDCQWTLVADETVQSGELELDIEPGETQPVRVPFERPTDPAPGMEYWLHLSFQQPEATDYADAGHEVAREQFEIPVDRPERAPLSAGQPPRVSETEAAVTVTGTNFEYEIDKPAGTLTSMRYEGTEILDRGPLFNAWRAPLMNDAQEWNGEQATAWRTAGLNTLNHEIESVDVSRTNEHAQIDIESFARGNEVNGSSAGFETTYQYQIFGNGAVTIAVDAIPNDELKAIVTGYLPKVGVQLELPSRFADIEWYGRGPQETFPDRKTGVDIGHYAGTVADQYVPYLPPTDNGNKTDTRWVALTDEENGLLARGAEPINVSCNRFSNVAAATHEYELEDRGSIAVNLDHRVSGVGGTPIDPHEEHQVQPVETSFEVSLLPFDAETEDPMTLVHPDR